MSLSRMKKAFGLYIGIILLLSCVMYGYVNGCMSSSNAGFGSNSRSLYTNHNTVASIETEPVRPLKEMRSFSMRQGRGIATMSVTLFLFCLLLSVLLCSVVFQNDFFAHIFARLRFIISFITLFVKVDVSKS